MEKINSGAPAFPSTRKVGSVELTDGGMSLRDYFAAKAMQSMMMPSPVMFNAIAEASYKVADAMLAARERSELRAE